MSTRADGARLAAAAGHPIAAEAATAVADAGGNAVDAAVAAAFVLSVALPDACGLGGDALLTVHAPGRDPVSFNGVGAAPAELRLPLPGDGAQLASVPGFVHGLADAHAQFGAMRWSDLLAPAIALAHDGVELTAAMADRLEHHRSRLERGGGADWPWLSGHAVVRQPRLAEALGRISDEGPAGFSVGPIAAAMQHAAAREGGRLSAADLAAHRTTVAGPIRTALGESTVLMQPPTSQALLLGVALAALERREAADEAARAHDAIEAIIAAFELRDEIVCTPAVDLIARGRSIDLPEHGGTRAGPGGYNHTTAVCTAGGDGLVVSMLISVFDDFGCATLVPEFGFLLNDRLLGASADPQSPNAPAAGRKPVHTLSPILVEHGDAVRALATPGADGQVQVLLQLLRATIEEGAALAGGPRRAAVAVGGRRARGGGHLSRPTRRRAQRPRPPGQAFAGGRWVVRRRLRSRGTRRPGHGVGRPTADGDVRGSVIDLEEYL